MFSTLHVITTPDLHSTPWSTPYLAGVALAGRVASVQIDIRHVLPDTNNIGLPDVYNGPVLLAHHTAFSYIDQIPDGVPVFIQDHSTPNPLQSGWSETDKSVYYHPKVSLYLSVSRSMTAYIQKRYPRIADKCIAPGFPYYDPMLSTMADRAPDWRSRKKSVVFAIRLHPNFEPEMAARLGFMLLDQGYKVTFCSPNHQSDPDAYPIAEWEQRGIRIRSFEKKAFLTELGQTQWVIVTGRQPVLPIVAYEGYMMGARPILPRHDGYGAPFSDCTSHGYAPGNELDIIRIITEGTPISLDMTCYDPHLFLRTILQTCREQGIA